MKARRATLVGGPAPYREALSTRLSQAGIEVGDDHADVHVVFASTPADWDRAALSAQDTSTVVVIPDHDLDLFVRALALSAGVVHFDTPTEIMTDVIEAAIAGEALLPLTVTTALASHMPPTQQDILGTEFNGLEKQIAMALLADRTVIEIARELSYSERTIRRRLQGIYLKLGVNDRRAAVDTLRSSKGEN